MRFVDFPSLYVEIYLSTSFILCCSRLWKKSWKWSRRMPIWRDLHYSWLMLLPVMSSCASVLTELAILAVFVSAPADCIKTHYQHCSQGMKLFRRLLTVTLGEYPNPMACFRVQVAREGWDSLWKGSLVRIMVVVPLYALTFIIFETLQRWGQENIGC